MSFGFEIYGPTGALMFGTGSVAFFLVDVFEITLAGGGGLKTYSALPSNAVVKVDWVSYNYSIDLTSTGLNRKAGYPWVSVSGKTVEWGWSDPTGNGYNTDRAIVRVFAA